jgi:hypothetical protein
MAYDEGLAERLREQFADRADCEEKRMFGGLCFMLHGNMCCGIVGETLMARVGADAYADALAQPHASEMDFTGRSMKGFVYVAPEGFEADAALTTWVARCTAFVDTLPEK